MSAHHDVQQGTDTWKALRESRFNGSEIAGLIGFSSYMDPISALNHKRSPDEVSESTQKFFDHGHKYETPGLAAFIDAMTPKNLRQSYTLPSGYYTPSETNINFLDMDDNLKFGVSLDGEGSLFDVEVKNPYVYMSFLRNYFETVQIDHFIQCQWAMAIRERSSMYYVATHFDPKTTQFLAIVIWKIDFNVDFFTNVIYPLAHKAYENFQLDRNNDLPWVNENKQFTNSKEYQDIFSTHCTKVYAKKEGHLISQIIKDRQK